MEQHSQGYHIIFSVARVTLFKRITRLFQELEDLELDSAIELRKIETARSDKPTCSSSVVSLLGVFG